MDTLTKKERSKRMSLIGGKDSVPEMKLRRLIHRMGFRYRLHVKELPGKPDMVFPVRKSVIFMHGCYWHRHDDCKLARLPKSRLDFWLPKLENNKRRDKKNQEELKELGWRVLIVWECEMKNVKAVALKVKNFLEKQGDYDEIS